MNAKTLISLLAQIDPLADVLIVMQRGPAPGARDLDDSDCDHELACEPSAEDSDLIVAGVEGHPAWLVVRPSERQPASGRPGRLHPLCYSCGWRKGGTDSWDGAACKCGHSEPALAPDPEQPT